MSEETMTRAGSLQNFIPVIARTFMSVPFIWSGFGKLVSAAAYQANFAKLGLPMPKAAWALAVFIEIVGAGALLFGIQTRVAASILAVWCIATALVAHTNFADPNMQIHFLKNVVMMGGFLYIAADHRRTARG